MGRTLVLTISLIMAAIGIALTGLICLSGIWGIGHMWPVLMLSVPLLVTGIYVFRLWLREKVLLACHKERVFRNHKNCQTD